MISLMITLMMATWLYVVWRVILPLRLSRNSKIVAALLLLPIAEYHLVLATLFGSFSAVELPRWLMIALSFAFGSHFLLALLLLLRDLATVMLWLVSRAGAGRLFTSRPLTLVLVLMALLLAAIGTWQGVKQPAIKQVDVQLPGLPAAFDGYRVVQLSDLHATSLLPASWMAEVVRRSNALQPDLIVITGDLQDGKPATRGKDVAPLKHLRAKDGVVVIAGNHEYYSDYRQWLTFFREQGLLVLENDHLLIQRGGATLAVAGLTDRQASRFKQPPPNLKMALAGIPASAPILLLSHRPDTAHDSAKAGVALQLSGHTHGGQVWGLHWITQASNGGFVSGLYHIGKMQLYVSNGTGLWSGFALRLGRPAEITLLTLHASP